MNELGICMYEEQFERLESSLRHISQNLYGISTLLHDEEAIRLVALHALLSRGVDLEDACRQAKLVARTMRLDD